MQIFYRQSSAEQGSLNRIGIRDCYLKRLRLERDQYTVTKKRHHHTGFELHMIADGCQIYEIGQKEYRITGGDFLLIYPGTAHRVVGSERRTEKYSITFQMKTDLDEECFFGRASQRIWDDLRFITCEAEQKKEISPVLVENSILEILVSVLRLSGAEEKPRTETPDENAVLALAKQYIKDNIEHSPDVCEVAEYCCLSRKQMTRIFSRFEGVSPGAYIRAQQVTRLEEMLLTGTLSLKEISERMNFSSEYYFNTFFKKHTGMSPGEYKKMLGK